MAYSKITNVAGKSRLVAEDSNRAPADIISKKTGHSALSTCITSRNRTIYDM